MAYTFTTELKSIAGSYTKLIDAKVTASTIETELEEHPDYPSLLALSEVFDRYRINNEAFRVTREEFSEIEGQTPFVAFYNIAEIGSDFILITYISDSEVVFQHKDRRKQRVSKEEFFENFKYIVWMAEISELSGDSNFAKIQKGERNKFYKGVLGKIVASILLLVVLSASIPSDEFIPSYLSIAFLKGAGLFIAMLLLIYEVDKSNAFVKNICSVGKKANCDAVLTSQASKIWGISWGEIGFFYFASTFLWILLPTISFETKGICLAIANAFASPYILFSIYYQWQVVKQWCVLCLITQTVLGSELLWSLIVGWYFPLNDLYSPSLVISIAFCILLPIVIWYGFKPILIRSMDHNLYKSAYKRLQYNPDLFRSLLEQQEQAPDGWQDLGIDVGNPAAANLIIKICNPYCNPCNKAHESLEDVIKSNENVKLKIIYINKNSEFLKGAVVIKHLLSIAQEGDSIRLQNALDDWYLNVGKDYDLFATKYPTSIDPQTQGEKINKMSTWCRKANVTHTPTIFVNGFRLPENYDIQELKYIL